MNTVQPNTDQLLAEWLKNYIITLPPETAVLSIRRAEPRFQNRNYFARFKIQTAQLDGTGMNPTHMSCFVVEVSETDQNARIAPETACNSIADL